MNPIVKILDKGLVVYELIEKDFKKLGRIKLTMGAGDGAHEICIMQATAMVTTEADRKIVKYDPDVDRDLKDDEITEYTDNPICVSEVITSAMINTNDAVKSSRERAKLKKLIPEIINTCPVRRKDFKTKPSIEGRWRTPEYKKAEKRRAEILNQIEDFEDPTIPLKRKIEVIREAAQVFRSTDLAT